MTEVEELEAAFANIESPISFTRRPDQIPGDLRLNWRLSAMAMVLERCRGGTANLEQMHLLMWALRSPSSRDLVARWFQGERMPEDVGVRFDPSMTRTIALAAALGYVSRNANQTITLTDTGARLANTVWSNKDVMKQEKDFLQKLPRKISQKVIRELMDWR